MVKKINIKKSILLIKLLIEEKEECERICELAKREFEESIIQAHYDFNVHDEALDERSQSKTGESDRIDNEKGQISDSLDTNIEDIEKKDQHPDWIKKLYRKIAIATHPDKMHKSASESMKKRFLSIYTESKIALERYDYMPVVIFASDIDIEIPEDEVIRSGIIDTKNKELEIEISSLKRSVYWQWASSSEDQKEKILRDFIESRGWMSKDNHRKKSRRGTGKHPGKSISQIKKSTILKKKEEK